VEEENLLIAQEVPPWHGEVVLAWPRWHQARERHRHHIGKAPHPPTPDLAEGKAKQLETKLEVAMAKIQSTGGDGDESTRGIDQISQTGRCAVARSIDCDPSRWLTPAEAVVIERSGGGAMQSPELGLERRMR
jgi:hypothetical protein